MGTDAIYHWELEHGTERIAVNVDWAVVAGETALAIEMAETGGGITYCQEGLVAAQLAAGTLRQVLSKWSSFGPAFHIYYPSRRQVSQALRSPIAYLQERLRPDIARTLPNDSEGATEKPCRE